MRAGAPRALLAQAAEVTAGLPYRVWGFGEGPGLLGLLAAGETLGREHLIQRVAELVTPTLDEAGTPEEHLVSAEVLTHLHRLRPEVPDEAAISSWVRRIENAPRPVAGRPPVHRPDLHGLGRLIWVDCMHTDGPGLAIAGRPAPRLVEENAAVLQDETGLFHHGYDVVADIGNGVHWGRGQGWALWGLVGTLAHTYDAGLTRRLEHLLTALAQWENDGQWRTAVDEPDSPWESSTCALVAAGILAGLDTGVVAPRWAALAERALAAATSSAAIHGRLSVSEATPVGSLITYSTRRNGTYPWGQGPLLLALAVTLGWSPFPSKETR